MSPGWELGTGVGSSCGEADGFDIGGDAYVGASLVSSRTECCR